MLAGNSARETGRSTLSGRPAQPEMKSNATSAEIPREIYKLGCLTREVFMDVPVLWAVWLVGQFEAVAVQLESVDGLQDRALPVFEIMILRISSF